tara:strand:+ start:510 stop:659 length:150 start_codon:yes stop_codon:yes gene_type:complete
MDFITGFIIGYFLKIIFTYLKKISESNLNNNMYLNEDWDWISLREDDLP